MPTYDFRNSETGEVEEHFVRLSDRDEFLANNPHLTQVPAAPLIGDPLRMGTYTNKLPTQFREGILDKAKKAHPLGNIQT